VEASISTQVRLLAVICVSLLACTKQEKPATGLITLTHVKSSDSELEFNLVNGSRSSISFHGWSRLLGAVEPSARELSLTCYSADSGVLVGRSILHGSSAETIEVSSNGRKRLAISKEYFLEFKGSECQLQLHLADGSSVESAKFRP
jgi:hypothetical protein